MIELLELFIAVNVGVVLLAGMILVIKYAAMAVILGMMLIIRR